MRALSFLMFGSMGAAFLYLVVSGEAASYGRYSKPGASPIPHVGARLAWFIQEVPALAIPLAFGMGNRALIWTRTPNLLVWVLFIAHYANR